MEEIWRSTPVRDGLECYFRILQKEAMAELMHAQLLYVQNGLKKKPEVPAILKLRGARKRRRNGPFKTPEKPAFLTALEDRE